MYDKSVLIKQVLYYEPTEPFLVTKPTICFWILKSKGTSTHSQKNQTKNERTTIVYCIGSLCLESKI